MRFRVGQLRRLTSHGCFRTRLYPFLFGWQVGSRSAPLRTWAHGRVSAALHNYIHLRLRVKALPHCPAIDANERKGKLIASTCAWPEPAYSIALPVPPQIGRA